MKLWQSWSVRQIQHERVNTNDNSAFCILNSAFNMVPRRQQTNPTMEQPVRLYKFIALTFLLITIALLGVIVLMSTKRAVITIESRPSPVNTTTKIAVGPASGGTDSRPGAIAGQVASARVSETATFQPTGTREEPAIATGTVKIHNETNGAQALVRTTRLLSESGVLFRLDQRVLVPAGGTVEAEVYADQLGAAGNIGSTRFTIPGLRADKQKEIYAASAQAMTGGTRAIGVVSQEDLEAAEKQLLARLVETGKKQLTGAGEKNGVFTVVQSAFEREIEIGAEVSDFALTGQATIAGVFFAAADAQAIAREQLLKRAVDDTEVIEESAAPPVVTIAAADLEAGTATLEVAQGGTALLNPESKQLEKSIFFGKNKDEVRRYVLKLDHVNGVEVKFRPAWARTVPAVAEQVTVVVKQIE